jgi:cobalt-zinc-cadmium efflux system membrane fusion protein
MQNDSSQYVWVKTGKINLLNVQSPQGKQIRNDKSSFRFESWETIMTEGGIYMLDAK